MHSLWTGRDRKLPQTTTTTTFCQKLNKVRTTLPLKITFTEFLRKRIPEKAHPSLRKRILPCESASLTVCKAVRFSETVRHEFVPFCRSSFRLFTWSRSGLERTERNREIGIIRSSGQTVVSRWLNHIISSSSRRRWFLHTPHTHAELFTRTDFERQCNKLQVFFYLFIYVWRVIHCNIQSIFHVPQLRNGPKRPVSLSLSPVLIIGVCDLHDVPQFNLRKHLRVHHQLVIWKRRGVIKHTRFPDQLGVCLIVCVNNRLCENLIFRTGYVEVERLFGGRHLKQQRKGNACYDIIMTSEEIHLFHMMTFD